MLNRKEVQAKLIAARAAQDSFWRIAQGVSIPLSSPAHFEAALLDSKVKELEALLELADEEDGQTDASFPRGFLTACVRALAKRDRRLMENEPVNGASVDSIADFLTDVGWPFSTRNNLKSTIRTTLIRLGYGQSRKS